MASREKSATATLPTGPAQGLPGVGISQGLAHGRGQGRGVPRGDQPAGAARNHQLRQPSHPGGRHRQARGHSLQDHIGQGLVTGTQDQQAGLVQQRPDVGLPRPKPDPARRQSPGGQGLDGRQPGAVPQQP